MIYAEWSRFNACLYIQFTHYIRSALLLPQNVSYLFRIALLAHFLSPTYCTHHFQYALFTAFRRIHHTHTILIASMFRILLTRIAPRSQHGRICSRSLKFSSDRRQLHTRDTDTVQYRTKCYQPCTTPITEQHASSSLPIVLLTMHHRHRTFMSGLSLADGWLAMTTLNFCLGNTRMRLLVLGRAGPRSLHYHIERASSEPQPLYYYPSSAITGYLLTLSPSLPFTVAADALSRA